MSLTTILDDPINPQIESPNPQIESLRQQLLMSEESRTQMQTNYLELKQKFNELMTEKQILESMVNQKNEVLGAPMNIRIKTMKLVEFYKKQYRDEVCLVINHQGLILDMKP